MNALQNNAHWLLRIALASVFIFQGFGKVANVSGFAEMMGQPILVAGLVTFAEVAGGLGILIGGYGVPGGSGSDRHLLPDRG